MSGTPSRPLVVIPSRLAATRLPDKPLADICGVPMIVQVWRRAVEANVGPVLVAAAEAPIVDAVRQAGGEATLTRPDHLSGSDRILEAVERFDPDRRFDAIVNLQGDLPTIEPAAVRAALAPLADPEAGAPPVDISTIAAEITRDEEKSDPNVVKAVVAFTRGGGTRPPMGRALYFTRVTAPSGSGPLYHHIGLYVYRRTALERFVRLPQGVLERRERLEQLRALENGMRIDVARVDTVPLGVDTPADLGRARALLADLKPRR
ncbi:MAG TPA: 3-deoxy-manno-octulosonate cytidylyltransferase [Alphaproteobacteria bacterium]